MANVNDDEFETLVFADESEYIGDDEDEIGEHNDEDPPPFWTPTYNGLLSRYMMYDHVTLVEHAVTFLVRWWPALGYRLAHHHLRHLYPDW